MQPSLRGTSAGGGREGTSRCQPMQGGPVGPGAPSPERGLHVALPRQSTFTCMLFGGPRQAGLSGARSTMGSAGSQQRRGGCLFSGAPVRDGIEPDRCFSSGN